MSIDSVLAAYMKKLNGPASIEQLFEAGFIEAHSGCGCAREFFSGAGVSDQATLDAWLAANPDSYVCAHTDFNSWSEMREAAWKRLAEIRQRQLRSTGAIDLPVKGDDDFTSIQFGANISVR